MNKIYNNIIIQNSKRIIKLSQSSSSSSSLIKRYYSIGYVGVPKGELGKEDFKVNFYKTYSNPKFIKSSNKLASPWHSISLKSDFNSDLFNCVIEMPKGTDEKMEVSTKELYNPIKQDIKDGKLRYIKHGKIPYNYGMIPRTWEDPSQPDPITKIPGDNDPIDVVEISDDPIPMGSIVSIRVLGAISLIDEGETDWKIIAIQKDNPNFESIKNLDDLENKLPGTLNKIKDWYQNYKVCEGKEPNTIYNTLGPVDARKVIFVANNHYHELISTFTLK